MKLVIVALALAGLWTIALAWLHVMALLAVGT